MTQKTSFLQKLLLVIFGILLSIVLLELGLRIAGAILLSMQEYRNHRLAKQQGVYKIVCIGESTTMSGGENSYPRQLERILNAKSKGIKFQVINKGVSGTTTPVIISHLPAILDETNPNMVIVMMGINDGKVYVPIEKITGWHRILAYLRDFRVYKLFKRIILGLRVNMSAMHNDRKDSSYRGKDDKIYTGEKFIASEFNKYPLKYRKLYLQGLFLDASNRYAEAEKVWKFFIFSKIIPTLETHFYKKLAKCLYEQGKIDELISILAHVPYNAWASCSVLDLCNDSKRAPMIISVINKNIKEASDNPELYDLMSDCLKRAGAEKKAVEYMRKADELRRGHINAITQKNYLKLNDMLERRHIKPIYMQYPLRSIDTLKAMLRSVDNFNQIIFIDNKAIFEKALSKGTYDEYFTDRFAGDFGHCTSKGNRLIAEHVAEIILKYLSH